MKKVAIIILVIIIALIIANFVLTNGTYTTVEVSGNSIKVEIADTQQERIDGLMFRESLAANQGMLFIFDEENMHGIWMKNMRFSIDILWIDRELKIVDIVENAQPCETDCQTYFPDEKALYVLEVNSGFATKNNVSIGDSIKIS